MTIYIVLLIAILLYGMLLRLNPKNKNMKLLFLFLAFSSCTIVLGLRRFNVGEDTGEYMRIFSETIPLKTILTAPGFKLPYFTDQYGYSSSVESGFLLWCKFVHIFSNNPQVFIFLTAGLTCFLFAKFIYDNCKNDVFFPTMVFLCESSFMLSASLIREMLACSVALQAYSLLTQKKVCRATIILLIAYSIHNSAIVTLLWIPILLFKPKHKTSSFSLAMIGAVLLPFIAISMQNVVTKLFPDYSLYYTKNYYQNSFGVGTILLLTYEVIIILYMFRKRFIINNSDKISLMVLIYIAFEITGIKIVMMSRIAIYFRAYLILFFNKFFNGLSNNYKLLFKSFTLLLLILFYLSFAGNSSRIYSFFWD